MGTYTGQDKRLQYLFQNGGGGGGGTNVEANPQGTPTDFLNTIKIGALIYDVGKIGDVYSTEERQVGCWINSKPLYQKTFPYHKTNIAGNSNFDITSDLNGIENVIAYQSRIKYVVNASTKGEYYSDDLVRLAKDSADAYRIYLTIGQASFSTADIDLTVLYTKTTDTAGSGIWTPSGSYAHHYTTDEQIIGTYLGQTLYEKTFTTDPVNVPTNSNVTVNLSNYGITNVEKILKIEGHADTLGLPLPYIAMNNNNRYEITVAASNTTSLIISRTGGAISNQVFTLTLQYTKSA